MQSRISLLSISVELDSCAGSCITINDLFNKACVPNKTEDLNLSVFNLISGINQLKTLTKPYFMRM